VPLNGHFEELDEKGKKQTREVVFDKDEGVRRDSSIEGLGETQARVSREGNDHGRQRVADV
jgi:hypothetical protein